VNPRTLEEAYTQIGTVLIDQLRDLASATQGVPTSGNIPSRSCRKQTIDRSYPLRGDRERPGAPWPVTWSGLTRATDTDRWSSRSVIERLIAHFTAWRIMPTDYRRAPNTVDTTISAVVGLSFYPLA